MNAKPTPGPMRVSFNEKGELVIAFDAPTRLTFLEWIHLFVTSVNACFQINPDNPLAVAEALPELVEACREALAFLRDPNGWERAHNPKGEFLPNMLEAALAKLEAKP
jgi:hypothetical protein